MTQFDNDASTEALLSLPRRRIDLAQRTPPGRRAARIFMTSVTFEMPLTMPFRNGSADETIELYFQELKARLTTESIGTALIHFHVATGCVAPDLRAASLRPITSRLRRDSVSNKLKRDRLVASGELLRLGFDLMFDARAIAATRGHARLLQYRGGLAIALLAMRPLRLGNFLDVRIRVDLADRFGVPWLSFPRTGT